MIELAGTMLRRLTPPRKRFTIVRLLAMVALSLLAVSIVYYWSSPHKDKTLKLSGHSERIIEPWERSVSLMTENDDIDEDFEVPGLVQDSVTSSTPDEKVTVDVDIDEQISEDVLAFTPKKSKSPESEEEDLHIGVERKEVQEWEHSLMNLTDIDDSNEFGLVEDDHIPGLVDDVKSALASETSSMVAGKRHKFRYEGSVKDSLLEEELEAVAAIAEKDAIRDAENQEWAQLGAVQEAKAWKKDAGVDWKKDEEEVEQEMEEAEQKEEERRAARKTKPKKTNKLKTDKKGSRVEVEEGYASTTVPTVTEATSLEPTTLLPDETDEEVRMEEEQEEEIFNKPETRLIGRLLLKLGLDGRNKRFRTALETYSKDRTIMLTLSDSRYTMMVLNFYESVVLKLGVKNVLFGSLDTRLCQKLETLNIPCFVYAWEKITDHDIQGGIRKIFNRKVYYRARMILEAIAMGYTVLYSDVDTLYFRDPFHDVAQMCGDCDVAFQQYTPLARKLSWGLNYARPTVPSLYLYYSITRKSYNRTTIGLPTKFINRLHREKKLNILRLPHMKCRSGIEFFDKYKFGWDNRCWGCVSVHSDETYTKEAKMYQLKELLLWNLNVDKYYSNRERRFLQYDNPYIFHNGTETLIMEMKALRNALALGQILQRIVVLPRFHCFVPVPREGEPPAEPPANKWCNLHDVLRIEPFHRWFMGRYREHAFLLHPKVPRVIKKNVSEVFYIGQKLPQDPGPDGVSVTVANVTLIKPRSPLYGAMSEEIRQFFNDNKAPVLRFHSLYYGFSHFLSDEVARVFNRRIKLGFDFRKRVHYTVRKLKVKKPDRSVMPFGAHQGHGFGAGGPGGATFGGAGFYAGGAQVVQPNTAGLSHQSYNQPQGHHGQHNQALQLQVDAKDEQLDDEDYDEDGLVEDYPDGAGSPHERSSHEDEMFFAPPSSHDTFLIS